MPLFALLDDDDLAVLAGQVDLAHLAPRQRIDKSCDPGTYAYVTISGAVEVMTIDEDNQDVSSTIRAAVKVACGFHAGSPRGRHELPQPSAWRARDSARRSFARC